MQGKNIQDIEKYFRALIIEYCRINKLFVFVKMSLFVSGIHGYWKGDGMF